MRVSTLSLVCFTVREYGPEETRHHHDSREDLLLEDPPFLPGRTSTPSRIGQEGRIFGGGKGTIPSNELQWQRLAQRIHSQTAEITTAEHQVSSRRESMSCNNRLRATTATFLFRHEMGCRSAVRRGRITSRPYLRQHTSSRPYTNPARAKGRMQRSCDVVGISV
ncbi:hypothetical protein BDV96DRAFT_560962, partial [Lophiotrema nucula]